MTHASSRTVAVHGFGFRVLSVLCAFIGLLTAAMAEQPPGAGPVAVQQPVFGVAVDADGLLKVALHRDPNGALRLKYLAAAKNKFPANLMQASKLRKISLVRLEQAIRKKLDAGEKPDETMRHLAGLLRIQYVFYYPKTQDIVIAGPAEGWVPDASGRVLGIRTHRPVLRLDDLLVALRAYPPMPDRSIAWLGCSISPTKQALEKLRAFQRTIPRTIPERRRAEATAWIAKGVINSLGMTYISVFGISPKTHFAQVLVEADYRMKRIGINLEPAPVKMTTFLGALKSPRTGSVLRWWFTPNYECVKVSQDQLAMELVGHGVQLLGEHYVLQSDGKLVAKNGTQPTRPSRIFTTGFTRKYPDIAARSPVFAEMRNLIDMAVAAAFMRQQDYYGKAGWRMETLRDETALPTQTFNIPKKVPATVNVVWKGNRLLAPSGGVSIQPEMAFARDHLIGDKDGKLSDQHERVGATLAADRWWWD